MFKSQKSEDFESMINKMMAAKKVKDPEKLIDEFIMVEEQNFALFKFVNDLNLEIENFESQIYDI